MAQVIKEQRPGESHYIYNQSPQFSHQTPLQTYAAIAGSWQRRLTNLSLGAKARFHHSL